MRRLIRLLPALALALGAALTAGPAHAQASNATAFQNVSDGLCLEVSGQSSGLQNGAQVQQWGCNGGDNQQWIVWNAGGGFLEIVNRYSGKCLEMAGLPATQTWGAHLQQWDCNNGRNQLWMLGSWEATSGRNARTLQNAAYLCAEIPGNPADGTWGTAAQQWPCNHGPNQLWWTDYSFIF
jgi:hypothetical protein